MPLSPVLNRCVQGGPLWYIYPRDRSQARARTLGRGQASTRWRTDSPEESGPQHGVRRGAAKYSANCFASRRSVSGAPRHRARRDDCARYAPFRPRPVPHLAAGRRLIAAARLAKVGAYMSYESAPCWGLVGGKLCRITRPTPGDIVDTGHDGIPMPIEPQEVTSSRIGWPDYSVWVKEDPSPGRYPQPRNAML